MASNENIVSAYVCRIVDGKLQTHHTYAQRIICVPLDSALPKLASGMSMTIAMTEMTALRARLQRVGIDTSGPQEE